MNQTEPRGLRKRHRDKGDLLFYGLLLALPLAQILVFYFGVNFQSILMAFQRYDACVKGKDDPVRYQQATEENIVKTQEVIEYYGKYWLICHTDMQKIGL